MDVRRLEYFVGVAEAGSVSAAALRMGISQPSLSRQISLLEEELGLKLFHRQRKGVSLTQDGDTLYFRISQPLREIDLALRDARSDTRKKRASIVLAIPPSVGQILAGPLTRRFAAFAPQISLRIAESPGGNLANLIRRHEFDMAIVYGPAESWGQMEWRHLLSDVAHLPLLEEEMVLIGPATSDLRRDEALSIEFLADLPLVFPSRSNLPVIFRELLLEMTENLHKPIEKYVESDSFQQTKEMAISGIGYAIVPISAIGSELELGTLRCAPIGSPKMTRQLVLVSRTKSPHLDILERAIELLLAEIKELVSSGFWPARILF